jgi:microcin C transport system ATP-binding protein
MAMLLVSHDLASVADHADRLLVMKHGRMMETGPARTLVSTPRSDYAKALVAATPRLDAPIAARPAVGGMLLEANAIRVSFPRPGWRSGRMLAVDGASLVCARGRMSGAGRGLRFRQIHARTRHCPAGAV